jgi:hypothetical protein
MTQYIEVYLTGSAPTLAHGSDHGLQDRSGLDRRPPDYGPFKLPTETEKPEALERLLLDRFAAKVSSEWSIVVRYVRGQGKGIAWRVKASPLPRSVGQGNGEPSRFRTASQL